MALNFINSHMDEKIKKIIETYPFLSYGVMNDQEYLGIIQNSDNQLISIYCLDYIPNEIRSEFLSLGIEWWWGSNRMVPINIFLKEKFRKFRPYLKHFNSKDFDLICGHTVSLESTISKKIRRRQITLVCKPN